MTDKTKNTSVRSRSLQYILKFPGVTSIEVADALNISPANVSPALSELYAEGKLERQKIPGSHGAYAYFVPDRKPVASVKQLQPDLPWPGNAGLQGRYNEAKAEARALEASRDRLEIEVVELRQWKIDAIAKYPDLVPTDPLLIKARQVASRELYDQPDSPMTKAILSGEKDDTPAVRIALAALRTLQEA